MWTEILLTLSLVIGVIALGLSAVNLLHRVQTDELEARTRRLDLEVADLVDRLSLWQRRDAARQRKMGGDPADVRGGSQSDLNLVGGTGVDKGALRAAARARGLMR